MEKDESVTSCWWRRRKEGIDKKSVAGREDAGRDVGGMVEGRRSRLKGMPNIDGIRSSLGSPLDVDAGRRRDREQEERRQKEGRNNRTEQRQTGYRLPCGRQTGKPKTGRTTKADKDKQTRRQANKLRQT